MIPDPPEVPETLVETQGVPRAEQKIGNDFFASFVPPERVSIAMAAIAALLVVVIGAAVYFGLLRWGYPAAEFVAAIFFAVVLVRQLVGRDREEVSAEEKSNSLTGLVPALAAGALAYAITVPLYFICDDFDHLSLLRQPFMTSLWPQITRGQFDGHVYIFYRPLGFASLFLDYRLWHDWTPGYHLTNLVLHLLCVAAVFFLCRELGLSGRVSSTAALVFAILPVNAQAVTWIACRFDQLATTFMLWALVCSVRSRRTGEIGFYILAILAFVLAALSKESAYALPFLWLALELLPWDENRIRYRTTERIRLLLGYLGIAAVTFFHRWHVLGGIGGYHFEDGSPVAPHFGTASLLGVLVHAPTQMLFGYNLLQPAQIIPLIFLTTLTAAILITCAVLAKRTARSRRVACFCLIWIFTATLPSHFSFQMPDIALFYSRALHFGSAGLAILLALLLNGAFRQPKLRLGWTLALCLLLVVGLEQNLKAWQWVSETTQVFLTELKRLEPSPPPGTQFYVGGVPHVIRGVPFFHVGLQSAVQFDYDWRTDISAEHLETVSMPVVPANAILVGWLSVQEKRLVSLGDTSRPLAVRLEPAHNP